MDVHDLSYAQKQRLAYIDFKLMFTGSVTRNEIIKRFEFGTAAASRDLALYKEYVPKNLTYNTKEKQYLLNPTFTPLFNHDARKTLIKLANQISDGFDAIHDVRYPVEAPSTLNVPDIMIVARLSQAIFQQNAVSIIYTSLSSGSAAREIVPHSIVDNGLRWHVRAFDRKSQEFRDFVLTRITKATVKNTKVSEFELPEQDHQWNRIMPLQVVPHPHNVYFPTAIELDFAMEGGMLLINVRAAMVGYLLRRWNVDCTEDATLSGSEYQLYLRNRQTLYGADNLSIAPGYKQINN